MKKYRPELFSTPMVVSIQNGLKTKTRRIIKNIEPNATYYCRSILGFAFREKLELEKPFSEQMVSVIEAPHQIGDIIWVRETWSPGCIENGKHTGFKYKADDETINVKWKPSIFMPRKAARIFLEVIDVHVEKLQDISEKDAIAEGTNPNLKVDDMKLLQGLGDWKIPRPFLEHQFGFLALWCKIYSIENWLSNPFVFVYTFKQVAKPNDF